MAEKDPYLAFLDDQIRTLRGATHPEYLECRVGALGHRWRLVQPDWKPMSGVKAIAKQCEHCTAIVRFNISVRYGEMLAKPSYEYPVGYKVSHSEGAIKPQAVRAVWAKNINESLLPAMIPHLAPVPADQE